MVQDTYTVGQGSLHPQQCLCFSVLILQQIFVISFNHTITRITKWQVAMGIVSEEVEDFSKKSL